MNTKKLLYIFTTTILMIGVSFVVHAWIATYWLEYYHPVHTTNYWHLLPPVGWMSVVVIGIILGVLIGPLWRDIVYVQHKHRKFRHKSK